MRNYLMEVDQYFGGNYRFVVKAENKEEALKLGRNHVYNELTDKNVNILKYTVRVVKSLDRVFSVKEIKE